MKVSKTLYHWLLSLESFRVCGTHSTAHQLFVGNQGAISPFLGGQTRTNTRAHTHTHTQTHIHRETPKRTQYTHTYTRTNTRTHTRTHTHTTATHPPAGRARERDSDQSSPSTDTHTASLPSLVEKQNISPLPADAVSLRVAAAGEGEEAEGSDAL